MYAKSYLSIKSVCENLNPNDISMYSVCQCVHMPIRSWAPEPLHPIITKLGEQMLLLTNSQAVA